MAGGVAGFVGSGLLTENEIGEWQWTPLLVFLAGPAILGVSLEYAKERFREAQEVWEDADGWSPRVLAKMSLGLVAGTVAVIAGVILFGWLVLSGLPNLVRNLSNLVGRYL